MLTECPKLAALSGTFAVNTIVGKSTLYIAPAHQLASLAALDAMPFSFREHVVIEKSGGGKMSQYLNINQIYVQYLLDRFGE